MPALVPIAIAIIEGTAVTTGMIVSAIIGTALQAASFILAAKKPRQTRAAQQTTLQVGEVPRRAWLGRGWSAGYYIWGGNYDEDPNDRRFEVMRIGLADHEMSDLEGYTADGQFYTWEAGSGRGGAQSSFVNGGKNHLWIYWNNGVDNEVPPEVLAADWSHLPDGAPWTADDINAGCSEVWVIKRGSDSVWSGGRPSFMFFAGGARVYDPRKDSTIEGGSGSHREDDPDTWEQSENLILLSLAYRMGIYNYAGTTPQLMVGRGLTLEQALGVEGVTLAQFMAAANTADESVTTLTGSRNRYAGGLLGDSDEPYDDVLARFADGCAGIIAPRGGRLAIIPGAAQTPHSPGFTVDDLVPGEPIEFTPFLPITQRVNTVIGKFPSESLYGSAGSVLRRDYDDVIADGRPHEVTLDLSSIVWPESAQRIAEVFRREGRLEWRGRITLPPRFANLEVGDWIEGTMPEFGSEFMTWEDGDIITWDDGDTLTWDSYDTLTFRVEEEDRRINQSKRVLLRQIDSTCYDWNYLTDETADDSEAPAPPTAPFALALWDGGDRVLWDDGDTLGWDEA
jgi:hypothetical protein